MTPDKKSLKNGNGTIKNIALWVVIALIMVMLFHLFNQPASEATTFAYSEFIEMVDKGEIKEVVIQGNEIKGSLTDGTQFETYVPDDARIVERLTEKNVLISAKPSDDSPWYMSVLISWIPMLLLVGVWIFFMRQMQAGGTKAMSFGRSKAKLISQDNIKSPCLMWPV